MHSLRHYTRKLRVCGGTRQAATLPTRNARRRKVENRFQVFSAGELICFQFFQKRLRHPESKGSLHRPSFLDQQVSPEPLSCRLITLRIDWFPKATDAT